MSDSIRESVYIVINSVITLATITCLIIWIQQLWKFRRNLPGLLDHLVPMRSRKAPFWTLAEALILFGANIVFITALGNFSAGPEVRDLTDGASNAPSNTNSQMTFAMISLVAAICSCLITLAWLRFLNPQAIRRLSLIILPSDIALGIKASVLIIPPVLMLSGLVNLIVPYEHKVLDQVKEVDSIQIFAVMLLSTALIAPFFEEFLFRVLVQGGLQGMIDRVQHEPDLLADSESYRPNSLLPILISSVVFALMHLGQGAAYIPLFVLSLGLGYLYRQTGNITAPLVVHMVLNGMTMISVFTGPASL